MTIVFGAQTRASLYNTVWQSLAPKQRQHDVPKNSPAMQVSLSYLWLLPVCVCDRDRLRMELLEV